MLKNPLLLLLLFLHQFAFAYKTYGQTFNGSLGMRYLENGIKPLPTPDGGYLILGETYSFGNLKQNIYITRLNGTGQVTGTLAFGTSATNSPTGMVITKDFGLLVSADNLLVRINNAGKIMWSRIPSDSSIKIGCVLQRKSGGYAIAGNEGGAKFQKQLFVARLNEDGSKIWKKAFSSKYFIDYKALDMAEGSDGSVYVLAAIHLMANTTYTTYLLKLNADGSFAWGKPYKALLAPTNYAMAPLSLMRTKNGSFIINAHLSFGPSSFYVSFETDSEGSILSSKKMPYTVRSAHNHFSSIKNKLTDNYIGFHSSLTNDGGYITTGSALYDNLNFDLSYTKFNSGAQTCNDLATTLPPFSDTLQTITVYETTTTFPASPGDFVPINVTKFAGGTSKIICSSNKPSNRKAATVITPNNLSIKVIPNPITSKGDILFNSLQTEPGILSITDMHGKQLYSTSIVIYKGENKKQVDLSALPAAQYFVSVAGKTTSWRTVIIKM